MTPAEINTVKIIKHHKELQAALRLKEKYESLPITDEFWIKFHQKEYLKLQKHLSEVLPENLMIEEKIWTKVDFELLENLCYIDRFSKLDGLHNSTMAYQKLAELVASKKYLAFDIMRISSRGGGQYSNVIRAYRYEGDIQWFKETLILRLSLTIKSKKSAITLLSKKLSKPLNLVLDTLPMNPIVPPELKNEVPFPELKKVAWTKYEAGSISEADMESSLLTNPTAWGFAGWYPVAQQHSLVENGRIDAILGNDQGQLLLVELQKGTLSKDHYSKITVYRRQLAKDWNLDLKTIGMVVIVNSAGDTLRECCQDLNIQLFLKPMNETRQLVLEARTKWESRNT